MRDGAEPNWRKLPGLPRSAGIEPLYGDKKETWVHHIYKIPSYKMLAALSAITVVVFIWFNINYFGTTPNMMLIGVGLLWLWLGLAAAAGIIAMWDRSYRRKRYAVKIWLHGELENGSRVNHDSESPTLKTPEEVIEYLKTAVIPVVADVTIYVSFKLVFGFPDGTSSITLSNETLNKIRGNDDEKESSALVNIMKAMN